MSSGSASGPSPCRLAVALLAVVLEELLALGEHLGRHRNGVGFLRRPWRDGRAALAGSPRCPVPSRSRRTARARVPLTQPGIGSSLDDTFSPAMSDQELAFLDAAFLESDEARPIRIMAEYLEPLRRFKAQNIQDTVVFFGSARIRSRERPTTPWAGWSSSCSSAAPAAGARPAPAAARPTQAQRLALTRARRAVTMSRYYEDARRLAHLLTEWSLPSASSTTASWSARAAVPASWKRPTAAPSRPAARASASTSSCRSSRA